MGDPTLPELSKIRWLVLPHTFRLAGVMLLLRVFSGDLPEVFLAPAVMAVVAGASAPIVASALRNGRVPAWGLAVAWNVWGMADFAVGWTDVVILRPALLGAVSLAALSHGLRTDSVHPPHLVPGVVAESEGQGALRWPGARLTLGRNRPVREA
jgi:hypothetical protein